MPKFKNLPRDEGGQAISSSLTRKTIELLGDDDWQDIEVPEGEECKAVYFTAWTGDTSTYYHLTPPLEFFYRPGPSDPPFPMTNGPAPFAGQAGDVMGQVKMPNGQKLTILFLS